MRFAFCFLLLLHYTNLFSQESDTTYFDRLGYSHGPEQRSSSIFYELNDGKLRSGLVVRYYMDHSRYGEAIYVDNELTGPYVIYYKNGNLREKGFYKAGKNDGKEDRWYEDGQNRSTRYHFMNEGKSKVKVINVWDSIGTHLVVNGDGSFKGVDFNNPRFYSEGSYKKGDPIGEWKVHKDDKLLYLEKYDDNGQLLSGLSYDENGKEYRYDGREEQARYPGGPKGWAIHLKRTLRYPKEALRNGTQGRVFLSFVVDKDGSIEDIKVIKGIGSGCDDEAIRALKKSKKWIPGTQRGQPIKTRISIQITFRLN